MVRVKLPVEVVDVVVCDWARSIVVDGDRFSKGDSTGDS